MVQNNSENMSFIDKELKEKAFFLDEAQKIARFGYYTLDIATGNLELSTGLEEVFGISFEESKDIDTWLRIIHPDDRETMRLYFLEHVVRDKQPFDKRYRIIRSSDLQIRWVYGKGELTFNEQGTPVTIFGTIQDITGQVEFEEEIRTTRQLYEDLVEASQELIFQIDNKGRFVFVNKTSLDVLGYSPDEMIGREYFRFMNYQQFEKDLVVFREMMEKGNILGYETCFTDKSGYPVYLKVNAKQILDTDGTYMGARGTAFNITETVEAERLAREKSDELDNFFNMSLDLLAVANADGYFTRINPAWKEVLGFTRQELMGKKFIDFVHPDDVESTVEAVNQLYQGKMAINFVNRYIRKDGTYRHIEWRAIALGTAIYAAARDITTRVELEQSLKNANQELKESNKQKDKFLYIIAHDIRNPLNNLLGFTELLSSQYHSNSSDENYQMIQMLISNAHSLYELIENLLNWAISRVDKLNYYPLEVNVMALIQKTTTQLKSVSEAKKIRVEIHVDDSVSVWVDEVMMNTVLRNVLSNAIKFSHPESTILVGLQIREQNAVIEIKDHGVGIPADIIQQLFFAETTRSTPGTRGEGGTGFGLPLCYELMKIQKGTIDAISKEGEGSIFFMSVPLQDSEDA